jgi:hypothetical protein
MESLRSLEISVLVDMLAKHTKDYTAMFNEGSVNTEQFELCKVTIKTIQKEIESRRLSDSNTNITDPNIILPRED